MSATPRPTDRHPIRKCSAKPPARRGLSLLLSYLGNRTVEDGSDSVHGIRHCGSPSNCATAGKYSNVPRASRRQIDWRSEDRRRGSGEPRQRNRQSARQRHRRRLPGLPRPHSWPHLPQCQDVTVRRQQPPPIARSISLTSGQSSDE